jgi:DNA mismatch repair protein MutS
MEVREKDGTVVFLRRLKEGPAAGSYGLYVARLAGLSPAVLERASQIMDRLLVQDGNLKNVNYDQEPVNRNIHPLIKELSALDPEKITPLEALRLVTRWKEQLAGSAGNPPAASSKPRGGKTQDASPSLFD